MSLPQNFEIISLFFFGASFDSFFKILRVMEQWIMSYYTKSIYKIKVVFDFDIFIRLICIFYKIKYNYYFFDKLKQVYFFLFETRMRCEDERVTATIISLEIQTKTQGKKKKKKKKASEGIGGSYFFLSLFLLPCCISLSLSLRAHIRSSLSVFNLKIFDQLQTRILHLLQSVVKPTKTHPPSLSGFINFLLL